MPRLPSVPGENGAAAELNRKLLGQQSLELDADLALGPGDIVEVTVFDVAEFSNLRVRIPNSGEITVPLLGSLSAAGLTPVDLQNAIRARLQQKFMHDPQVSVFVQEHRSQRITVTGAVRTGGVFTLTNRLRLADALALAGGLADDAGSTVYLIRKVSPASPTNGASADPKPPGADGGTGSVMTVIDLESLASGKQEMNLPLRAGDVIEVPRAPSYYVGGQVNRPGSFPLKTRITLAQVSLIAGGLKEEADWDDVRLYRPRPDGTREVTRFSLDQFETGSVGPEIQPNDVIVYGRSYMKAFLYGVKDFFRVGIGATIPLF